jgi:16S rRNA (uracil1498-N3)-methyltransferase
MTVHRFYAARLPARGSEVHLEPEEGRHLIRVLRLRRGARVLVFDGQGRQHEATVADDDPRRPVLVLGAPSAAAPESLVRMTLGVTVLKGRKLDTVVRDATAFGVTGIVPLLTRRTESGGGQRAGGRLGDRWRGVAIAAAKQCGRAVVPTIHPPLTFARFLEDVRPCSVRLLLVEPGADAADATRIRMDALVNDSRPPSAALAIGPEGGWTDDEIRAAEAAGFGTLTLGRRTLRAETAPVAAIAVLRFAWRDL